MFDFVDYMRQIAIKSKDIAYDATDKKNKRFSRVSTVSSMEEFLQGINYTDGYVLIVQDDFYSRFIDMESENIQDNISNIFYLVKHVKDVNDFDAIEQAKKDTLSVTNKVIGRMLRDRRNDFKPVFPKTGMRNLEPGTIFRQRVGPLATGWYGIMCGFSMLVSINAELKYNDDDWDPDAVS